jgi:hypothetical protein
LVFINSAVSLQKAIPPLNSCTPRIPKTRRKSIIMSNTLRRLGILRSKEFTTVLIPIQLVE